MFEKLAESVVTAGIQALDHIKPEWLDTMPVEVTELNFMHPESCPLYYAFGDFLDGYHAARVAGYDINACGFAEPRVALDYLRGERSMLFAAVNAEWHARIAALRAAS